jgi:DNA-directed RNA polymerase sigma subunit (sigma70/sigma32)
VVRNVEIIIKYVTTDQSLDVIAKDYGLTRERVRQIVNQQLLYLGKELSDAKAQ